MLNTFLSDEYCYSNINLPRTSICFVSLVHTLLTVQTYSEMFPTNTEVEVMLSTLLYVEVFLSVTLCSKW